MGMPDDQRYSWRETSTGRRSNREPRLQRDCSSLFSAAGSTAQWWQATVPELWRTALGASASTTPCFCLPGNLAPPHYS